MLLRISQLLCIEVALVFVLLLVIFKIFINALTLTLVTEKGEFNEKG